MPFKGIKVKWNRYRFLLFLDDPTCRWLWTSNFLEFEELNYVAKKILHEGDIVIDVGAHYGYITTILSTAVGTRGLVIAIEAAPHTVSRLRKQITLFCYKNVIIVPKAIGERSEIRPMLVSFEGRQDYQAVTFGKDKKIPFPYFLAEEIMVRVTSLNIVVNEYKIISPCLVKLDIEGGELPALKGATDLLQSANPPWLFVEINKAAQERNEFSFKQLIDLTQLYSESQYAYEGVKGFVPILAEQVIQRLANTEYLNLLVQPPYGKYKDRQIQ
jgi:FkbM family methyltransferase